MCSEDIYVKLKADVLITQMKPESLDAHLQRVIRGTAECPRTKAAFKYGPRITGEGIPYYVVVVVGMLVRTLISDPREDLLNQNLWGRG